MAEFNSDNVKVISEMSALISLFLIIGLLLYNYTNKEIKLKKLDPKLLKLEIKRDSLQLEMLKVDIGIEK